jgi:signal peptidase I
MPWGLVIITAPFGLAVCSSIIFWMYWAVDMVSIAGSSNLPALKDGDRVFSVKTDGPARGELIMFYATASNRITDSGIPKYIKRVIGIPGDSITMVRGRIMLNGQLLPEDYTIPYWKKQNNFDDCSYLANSDFWMYKNRDLQKLKSPCDSSVKMHKPTPVVLASNQYFVVGDNRSPGGSEDSRAFGPIQQNAIIGVIRYVGIPPYTLEIPNELKRLER